MGRKQHSYTEGSVRVLVVQDSRNNTVIFSPAGGVRGAVVFSGGLAASAFRSGASVGRRSPDTLVNVPAVSQASVGSNPRQPSLLKVGNTVKCAGDRGCWVRALTLPEARFFGFGTFDAWLNAFMYTLKRDTIFNVGKIGGIILLYYLAPGVLYWFSDTFGAFG